MSWCSEDFSISYTLSMMLLFMIMKCVMIYDTALLFWTFTLFLIICVCINCHPMSTSYVHSRWYPWNRFLLYNCGKRLYAFWVFEQHYRVVIIYILIRAHDNSYFSECLLWIGSNAAKIYQFISLKSHIKIKIKCYAIKVTQEGWI